MKSLIITVAGTATRFNHDTEEETLKCLYHIGSPHNSLLYQIFDKSREIDEYIVVGGFLYDKLCTFIRTHCVEFADKIKTVFNPFFDTYGSGYSLIVGINAISTESNEVLFVEGDLFFDSKSYNQVKGSNLDVITINSEPIEARKSVVLYKNLQEHFHYVYDTSHAALRIDEPFMAIYNSGQIWKFCSPDKLCKTVAALTPDQERGTNLEIIERYFGDLKSSQIEVVPIVCWHNCNTVADYKQVYSIIAQ